MLPFYKNTQIVFFNPHFLIKIWVANNIKKQKVKVATCKIALEHKKSRLFVGDGF
jgi:hypothetical protein